MDTLDLFLQAAWKVLTWSLLLGAGLVAVFAVGVRGLAPARQSADRTRSPAGEPTVDNHPRASSLGVAAAVLCFLVVATGVALGLTFIVAAGQGDVLSFSHGYPTLVPKP
jgi:hypothetical protein